MISNALRIVALLVLTTTATAAVTISVHAQTPASGQQANAETLLGNMRRALATILVAYQAPDTAKSHAGALVLSGTKDAAVEVDRLKSALASRQPRAISEATRKTAEAIGRLDGIFRMAGSANPWAVEGMRALSANWTTYTARYALARPAQSRAKASAAQVAEVQRNVARLRREVQQLRVKVRDKDAVARDLDALYARIDRLEQRRITEETYNSALVALSAINGLFVGYEVVSRVYYPDVYVILHDRREQFSYYQGYWDGYYDAYYETWPATYYEATFEAPDVTVVNIDVTINQQVENYTTQNVDVFVQKTEVTEATFEVAPAPTDIEQRPATAVGPALDATELAETVQPDATALRALDGGVTTPAPEVQPVPRAAGIPATGRDSNDDDGSPSAPAVAPPQVKSGSTPKPTDRPDERGADASAPQTQAPAAVRPKGSNSPADEPDLKAAPRTDDRTKNVGGDDADDAPPPSGKEAALDKTTRTESDRDGEASDDTADRTSRSPPTRGRAARGNRAIRTGVRARRQSHCRGYATAYFRSKPARRRELTIGDDASLEYGSGRRHCGHGARPDQPSPCVSTSLSRRTIALASREPAWRPG